MYEPTATINTPYVSEFGNSIVFGNHADLFPLFFQPILGYTDWFLLDWPYQLVRLIINPNLPLSQGLGPIVLGLSIWWFIIGWVIAVNTKTGIVKEAMTLENNLISQSWIEQVQNGSVIGQLIVLPLVLVNLLFSFVYHAFVVVFYWHLVISELFGMILTLNGKIGAELSVIVERVVLGLLVIAPIINIVVRTFDLLLYHGQ